ncbi:MAG: hypothetical protein Q9217_001180 [Psora testacea]
MGRPCRDRKSQTGGESNVSEHRRPLASADRLEHSSPLPAYATENAARMEKGPSMLSMDGQFSVETPEDNFGDPSSILGPLRSPIERNSRQFEGSEIISVPPGASCTTAPMDSIPRATELRNNKSNSLITPFSDILDTSNSIFSDNADQFDVGMVLPDDFRMSSIVTLPNTSDYTTPTDTLTAPMDGNSRGEVSCNYGSYGDTSDFTIDTFRNSSHGCSDTVASRQNQNQQDDHGKAPGSTEIDPIEDCMQQLSDLNLRLYRQLKIIKSSQRPFSLSLSPSTSMCVDGSNNGAEATSTTLAIGDILDSSQKFLEILNTFLPFSGRPSIPYRNSSPSSVDSDSEEAGLPANDNIGTLNDRNTRMSSSLSGWTCRTPLSTPRSFTPSRSAAATKKRKESIPLAQPDTPTILLVSTCHIRLIRIYCTLFSHIHLSLLVRSSERAEMPPAFPGLQLGGFQVQSYGDLQIKILVQASMHMLDRIEKVLRLPEERGVGGRDNVNSRQSEDSMYAKLMDVVMKREESEDQGHGMGGVKSLKKDIKRVKKLLKERTAL